MNLESVMSSNYWPSPDELYYGTSEEEEMVMKEQLFDDVPPFFWVQNESCTESKHNNNSSITDKEGGDSNSKFNSAIYSGPTIGDIENALSVTANKIYPQQRHISQPRISILEKGISKIENKYTLKIKSVGNGMDDDGYKWRKYGQKSIKNSLNPRSYYRCTNPRCSAKKQVERSNDESDTLIITYEGLHLHFTYPFHVLGRAHEAHQVSKKPKKSSFENLGFIQELAHEERTCQGLLQDMVPLKILNPSSKESLLTSCSTHPSPPSSPSSLMASNLLARVSF